MEEERNQMRSEFEKEMRLKEEKMLKDSEEKLCESVELQRNLIIKQARLDVIHKVQEQLKKICEEDNSLYSAPVPAPVSQSIDQDASNDSSIRIQKSPSGKVLRTFSRKPSNIIRVPEAPLFEIVAQESRNNEENSTTLYLKKNSFTDKGSTTEHFTIQIDNDFSETSYKKDDNVEILINTEEDDSDDDRLSINECSNDLELENISEIVKSTMEQSTSSFDKNPTFDLKIKNKSENQESVQVSTDQKYMLFFDDVKEDVSTMMELCESGDDKPPVKLESTTSTAYFAKVDSDSVEIDENGEKKIFKCSKCPLTFARRIACKQHYTSHQISCGFQCTACKKYFITQSSHDRHFRTHSMEKPFKCNICQKSFSQKEVLKRHTQIHTYTDPLECSDCDKKFKQKEALKQHFYTAHTNNPTKFNCALCDKSFAYASGLSRHMLLHSGKNFSCFCGKIFADASAMKRHKNTHAKNETRLSTRTKCEKLS